MKRLIVLFFLFSYHLLPAQVFTEDLVFYYPFDGTAEDASGNGYAAHLAGATPATDRFGNPAACLDFDGVDDFVWIDSIAELAEVEDFTISVWYNNRAWEDQAGLANGIIDQTYIFNGHAHSAVITNDYLRPGLNVVLYLPTDSVSFIRNTTFYDLSNFYQVNIDSVENPLNSWHHTVFVRKGTQTFHYLDGVLLETADNENAPIDMNHYLFVGTFSGNNPHYNDFNYNFNGQIDELQFYKRALDSTEVEILFNGEVTTTSPATAELSWEVFPNPTNGLLQVQLEGMERAQNYRLKVYNSLGQQIWEGPLTEAISTVDLRSKASAGLYRLQLANAAGNIIDTRSVILQRE